MANKITILGDEELNYLMSVTARSLPTNPSEQGWSAERVKRAFYKGFEVVFRYLKDTQQEVQNYVDEIYIETLDELDSYTNYGIYRFNLANKEIFHLFVNDLGNVITQDRTSNSGHYTRDKMKGYQWNTWKFYRYSENGITKWDNKTSYGVGALVTNNNKLYVSLTYANGYALDEKTAWLELDFINYVKKGELNQYVIKENGKGLSTNDLTDSLLAKLNSLKNYDDTTIKNKITAIEKILVSDNVNLDTLQEIVDMLESNEGDINAIFTAIAKKVDKDGLKTINGESIVGNGNIEVKGADVDLSDYLKNGDNKPDTNIAVIYNAFNLYDSTYTSGLSIYKDSTGIFGSGNTIYLSNEGVKINGKSFNKLYEDVQLLKGNYDLIDYSSEYAYNTIVPSGMSKYAFISRVGGMSYKSNNLFNGVYEFGSLNTSTGAFEAGDFGCCSDYIKVDSNTTYSYRDKRNVSANFETIFYVVEYDVNKGFIQHKLKQLPVTNGIYFVSFTTQATTKYIRFMAIANYETEYMPTEATLVKGTYTVSTLNYIEYFEGLRHTAITEIHHTNRNILAGMEETENGYIGANDGTITKTTTARSYDFYYIGNIDSILVMIGNYSNLSNTYACRIGCYDANKNFLGFISITSNANTYTLIPNTRYIRFSTDKNATKVLIAFDTNFTYVAPKKYNTVHLEDIRYSELYNAYGLGINESCYNYLDFDKDVLVRKVGSYTFNGLESFSQASTAVTGKNRYWFTAIASFTKKPTASSIKGNVLFEGLETQNADTLYLAKENGIAIETSNGNVTFFINDIQNVTDLRNYLKGKTIYYELAEPIENAIPQIDTFIEVEAGDVITFKSDWDKEIPIVVEYIEVG